MIVPSVILVEVMPMDDETITYGLVVRGKIENISLLVRDAERVGVQVTGFAVRLDKNEFIIGTLQKRVRE